MTRRLTRRLTRRAPRPRPSTSAHAEPLPMRFRLLLATAALAASAAAAPRAVAAQPLTFETVATNAAGFNSAPFTTLGGYTFENFGVLTSGSTFGTGANAASGTKFAYGFAGGASSFLYRTDRAFDLFDAFLSFRTLDGNVAPATVVVRGYRGAAEAYSRTLTLTNSAQRFTFNFAAVDEVEFEAAALSGARSAVLALDDVNAAVVPEPATVALVGLGGVLVLGAARRRAA